MCWKSRRRTTTRNRASTACRGRRPSWRATVFHFFSPLLSPFQLTQLCSTVCATVLTCGLQLRRPLTMMLLLSSGGGGADMVAASSSTSTIIICNRWMVVANHPTDDVTNQKTIIKGRSRKTKENKQKANSTLVGNSHTNGRL